MVVYALHAMRGFGLEGGAMRVEWSGGSFDENNVRTLLNNLIKSHGDDDDHDDDNACSPNSI